MDRLDLRISTCSTLQEQMIGGVYLLELAEEAIIVEYETELECLVDSLISIQLKWKDDWRNLHIKLIVVDLALEVDQGIQRTTGVPVINWF